MILRFPDKNLPKLKHQEKPQLQ